MSKYRKALVAAIGVILTGLNAVYGANIYVQLVISLATAAGVYLAPNKVV